MKTLKIFFIILLLFTVIYVSILFSNFKNDYICSNLDDKELFKQYNCEKYNK